MNEIVTLMIAGCAALFAKGVSSLIRNWLQKTPTLIYEVTVPGRKTEGIEIRQKAGDTLDYSMQQVLEQAVKRLQGAQSKDELRRLTGELEAHRASKPYSGMLHITLGRLYRRLDDLESAIRVLSEYIVLKENANQRDDALAAAYYNRSCYEALRRDDVNCCLEDLRCALDLNSKLRTMVDADPDFDNIREELHPMLMVKTQTV